MTRQAWGDVVVLVWLGVVLALLAGRWFGVI